MSKGVISGFNFVEDFQAQKYWSFPSSYSKEKRQQELNSMLYSGQYYGAEKKDGYWERIIKDDEGNIFMCSRDKGVNGVIEKHQWVPHLHEFFNFLPNGTCIIGEVYLPGKTSKNITSILGCGVEKAILRQIDDKDKLRLYVFDIVAYAGEILLSKTMKERVTYLNSLHLQTDLVKKRGLIEFAKYVEFAKYWNTSEAIHKNWMRILAQDGEGVVMTRADYPYEQKKKTARKTLKLKKELTETVDVFLTGKFKPATFQYTGKDLENWEYWYNNITEERVFGKLNTRAQNDGLVPVTRLWYLEMAGAVQVAVVNEDKIIPVGWISGLDDEVRTGIVKNLKDYKGKVLELQAMEISREGEIPTLRHAKIERWRDDKSAKNCTLDQLL